MKDKYDLEKLLFKGKLFVSNNPYYVIKTQKKGEQDLVNVSKKAKREDSWTYFPSEEIWIHTSNGHSEKFRDNKIYKMSTIMSFIEPSDEFPNLDKQILYHIHPEFFLLELLGEEKFSEKKFREIYHGFLALPTKQDLKNTIEYPNIQHRIASPKGITSYQLVSGNPPDELFNEKELIKEGIIQLFLDKGFNAYMQRLIQRSKDKADLELTFKYME